MKDEINLWDKYLEHLDKLNEPIVKLNNTNIKKYIEKSKKNRKEYEVRMAEYRAKEKRRLMELEKYSNLPWYKKFFTPKPSFFEFNYYFLMPRYSIESFFICWPIKQPNYEEFLTMVARKEL